MPITDRAYVASPDQLAALPSLYQSAPRWITVVGAEGSDAEGFVATIRANPTNGTIQAISQPGALWDDVGPFLAPLIRSWNATTEEVEFEEVPAVLSEDGAEVAPARRKVKEVRTVPLPAPSEGDWTVLLRLDPKVREWVLEQCILARLHALSMNGESETSPKGKGSPAPSDSPPDGTPDGETPTTPTTDSRPRRKS